MKRPFNVQIPSLRFVVDLDEIVAVVAPLNPHDEHHGVILLKGNQQIEVPKAVAQSVARAIDGE